MSNWTAMRETEPENEMEDDDEGDDSYANAYLNDDVEESDDAELAEMLAKVQSIQQVEGRLPIDTATPAVDTDAKGSPMDAAKVSARAPPRVLITTSTEARKSLSLVKSPSAAATSSTGIYKSQDGITTISRNVLSARNTGAGTLLGVKKSAIYEDKLLQAATTPKAIKKLQQKAVASPPATIRKRTETLSAPPKKSTARKFATDDEELHCRFQMRKSAAKASPRDDFDGGGDSGQNFMTRMEAGERNRRKKLELSRGENDYNARLDKKACPKCGLPQSYSEFKDKKKKCQMCGVEFRFLNAWGDIEHSFTSRMADTLRAQAERKEQIYAQITSEETNRLKLHKTAKQLDYEKRLMMKHSTQTFLDRNYKPNSDSKTKKAQLELEAKRSTARSAK